MSNKKNILHIATGGTIAMKKAEDGTLTPYDSAQSLLDSVPEIKTFCNVDMIALPPIDSANIYPQYWIKIADSIVENYKKYDGFVVTHGTDTLAFTASALSFFIRELDKPVVLTGSQIAMSIIGSDAKRNLINAFRVATTNISEVVVVFGSKIIRGVRARKISAFSLEAFESINESPLGEIGLSLRIRSRAKKKAGRHLLYQPYLEPNVALVHIYPSFTAENLRDIVKRRKGIVLLGYGTGNMPVDEKHGILPVIKESTESGIPVMIGTQCVLGPTNLGLYRVGKEILDAGAIPSIDMTPEATYTKLMWVLGQTNDIKLIKSKMLKSYVGEISPYEI